MPAFIIAVLGIARIWRRRWATRSEFKLSIHADSKTSAAPKTTAAVNAPSGSGRREARRRRAQSGTAKMRALSRRSACHTYAERQRKIVFAQDLPAVAATARSPARTSRCSSGGSADSRSPSKPVGVKLPT